MIITLNLLLIPIYFRPTKTIYRKRRYECKNCKYSFYENNNFVNKYARKTRRISRFIVDRLHALDSVFNILEKLLLMQDMFLK